MEYSLCNEIRSLKSYDVARANISRRLYGEGDYASCRAETRVVYLIVVLKETA
jgi:hypothetical protein